MHGGRFNPKGIPSLYTAMSVLTAIREANQIGTLQPTTLVSYEADIMPIFDATGAEFCQGATGEDLNMVQWVWGRSLPAKLLLIGDEGRLGQQGTKRWAARPVQHIQGRELMAVSVALR